MHYYQFNIGDYASHTKSLSPIEDIAYRRLMDEYYLHEQPLNGCSTDVARCIGMRDYADEVEYILNRFFQKDGDFWLHKRIEREIEQYHNQRKARSKAGKASAKARQGKASEHVLNTRSASDEHVLNSVELTNNHKPITNNHNKHIPVNEIVDLFNRSFPELPQVQKVTQARSKAVKARWAEYKDMQDIAAWEAFFDYIKRSDFLMGRATSWQGLSFDWIFKAQNFLKIKEGNYQNAT